MQKVMKIYEIHEKKSSFLGETNLLNVPQVVKLCGEKAITPSLVEKCL